MLVLDKVSKIVRFLVFLEKSLKRTISCWDVQSRIFMNDSSFERFYFYTNYPGKKRMDNKKWIKQKTFRDEKNEIDNFGIMTSFYSIRQLGCILSTFMHRRHLMVWNVFAPRLLFEIAEFLVFLIFCFFILSTNVSIICSLEIWLVSF